MKRLIVATIHDNGGKTALMDIEDLFILDAIEEKRMGKLLERHGYKRVKVEGNGSSEVTSEPIYLKRS